MCPTGSRKLARSEHSLSHSSKLFPRLIHHKQKGIFEFCATLNSLTALHRDPTRRSTISFGHLTFTRDRV
jgi:hypothetical protein